MEKTTVQVRVLPAVREEPGMKEFPQDQLGNFIRGEMNMLGRVRCEAKSMNDRGQGVRRVCQPT